MCAETRSFWISWKGGLVVVGKEQIPYEHQLVLFSPMDELSYPIEAISVRTVGGDGVWTIDKMAGESVWTKGSFTLAQTNSETDTDCIKIILSVGLGQCEHFLEMGIHFHSFYA